MKSKISLSTYSIILTTVLTAVLAGLSVYTFGENLPAFILVLTVLLTLLVFSALYAPRYLEVTDRHIVVHSLLKNHTILLSDVVAVEQFAPTLGAIRIAASGGYFGYWGIFREGDIGLYTGYYGKASRCILVRLKNGDKYLLGTDDPAATAVCIASRLS